MILALDQATTTGWAMGEDSVLRHGVLRMPKRPDGERLMWLYERLVVLADSADQIVYETPIFPIGHAKFSPSVIGWLQKIEGVVLMAAAKLSIPAESKSAAWWHGALLGFSRKPKGAPDDFIKVKTAEKLRELGYEFSVQDEADAIGLLHTVIHDPSRRQGDLLEMVKGSL